MISVVKVRLATRVLEANDEVAQQNAEVIRAAGVYSLDMMSSPGSGKTTILERTLEQLGDQLRVAIVEGDVYTTRDAERVEAKGAEVVQVNTGGACHLDAGMVRDALQDLDLEAADILVVENVGNLICPVGFRLGTHDRVMVLSVTEGSDKPEKYPAMFRDCTLALVNKVDLLPALELELEEFVEEIRRVNPDMQILAISARTGAGMSAWCDWLRQRLAATRGECG